MRLYFLGPRALSTKALLSKFRVASPIHWSTIGVSRFLELGAVFAIYCSQSTSPLQVEAKFRFTERTQYFACSLWKSEVWVTVVVEKHGSKSIGFSWKIFAIQAIISFVLNLLARELRHLALSSLHLCLFNLLQDVLCEISGGLLHIFSNFI